MDNQHRKITGYRDLTQEEIDLMNKIKAAGTDVLRVLHDEISDAIAKRTEEFGTPDGESYRWLNIGRTHYQQALMAMTRAVASPNFE